MLSTIHTPGFKEMKGIYSWTEVKRLTRLPLTNKETLSKYSDGKDLVVVMNVKSPHGPLAESRVLGGTAQHPTIPPTTQQERFLSKHLLTKSFLDYFINVFKTNLINLCKSWILEKREPVIWKTRNFFSLSNLSFHFSLPFLLLWLIIKPISMLQGVN